MVDVLRLVLVDGRAVVDVLRVVLVVGRAVVVVVVERVVDVVLRVVDVVGRAGKVVAVDLRVALVDGRAVVDVERAPVVRLLVLILPAGLLPLFVAPPTGRASRLRLGVGSFL